MRKTLAVYVLLALLIVSAFLPYIANISKAQAQLQLPTTTRAKTRKRRYIGRRPYSATSIHMAVHRFRGTTPKDTVGNFAIYGSICNSGKINLAAVTAVYRV